MKNDNEEIESALNAIERKVPPSKIPEKDRELQAKAKETLEKAEKSIRMEYIDSSSPNSVTPKELTWPLM